MPYICENNTLVEIINASITIIIMKMGLWIILKYSHFYTPVIWRTYYGMALSVRPYVHLSIRT